MKIPSEKLQALVNGNVNYPRLCSNVVRNKIALILQRWSYRHFHQLVARSRYLSQEHKNIIEPVLHRNSYFAHSENVILAMKFKSSRKS